MFLHNVPGSSNFLRGLDKLLIVLKTEVPENSDISFVICLNVVLLGSSKVLVQNI